MKDKLKSIFSKKEDYYTPESNFASSEVENDRDIRKEIQALRKENERLKQNLKKSALDKFKTRRSIRKFSDKPILWETIGNIIEAGLNAPCAGNIQNYKVLVIQNQEDRTELGKLAFQQYWLAQAPVVLVVVRDNHRLMQLYPQEGEIYSVQNSAAFIENMLMYAHFCDLGACWVEAYDNEVLKEFLKIPPHMLVDAIIPIGYPLENPKVTKDTLFGKIFYTKWGNKERPKF